VTKRALPLRVYYVQKVGLLAGSMITPEKSRARIARPLLLKSTLDIACPLLSAIESGKRPI